VQLAMLKQL